ncbi:MAG: hypothetical protein J6D28_00675 [Bacilli bacterium]|nr:hypothetical protein [Bacilli bacterium]
MKNKKLNKVFKVVFYVCFLMFLTFYVAQNSGYYEYSARKKMTFTKEQIKRYEQDIKDGRAVDITSYLDNTDKNFQNKISSATLNISENISKYTRKGINFIFSYIGNAIEE